MVVEVVARQVGKQSRIEADTINPPLRQRMRRNLDRCTCGSRRYEVGEMSMQFDGRRRGHSLRTINRVNAVTQGSKVRAALTQNLPSLGN